MGMSAAEYLLQLQALLPEGAAWTREAEAVLTALLAGLAEEYARADSRGDDLLRQIDPRDADELLADWETTLGLPDICSQLLLITQGRREAAYTKLLTTGGASRQYFIDLAAALGYPDATIDEYRPMSCNDTCNDSLYSEDDRFVWQLNLPAAGVGATTIMTCNDSCCDYLRVFGGDYALECRIGRLKPAHTFLLFAYV